jgi:hypothetical protein
MQWDVSNISGAPLVAALIVLFAVIALGGISFAFQGSVQF